MSRSKSIEAVAPNNSGNPVRHSVTKSADEPRRQSNESCFKNMNWNAPTKQWRALLVRRNRHSQFGWARAFGKTAEQRQKSWVKGRKWVNRRGKKSMDLFLDCCQRRHTLRE